MNGPVVLRGGKRHASITVFPGGGNALLPALHDRQGELAFLRKAVLHKSLNDDTLIEYLEWDGEDFPSGEADRARALAIALGAKPGWAADSVTAVATAGSAWTEGDLELTADPSALRPVLVSLLGCEVERQGELRAYLEQAADRFRDIFDGWIGALLYPRADGRGVTEYLQFETADAMMALQRRPELAVHMERLAAFGATEAYAVLAAETRG